MTTCATRSGTPRSTSTRPRRSEGFPTPTVKHVRDDLPHNLVEMPHLAKLLPRLYSEEGEKPIGSY